MHLVQLMNRQGERALAGVESNILRRYKRFISTYEAAMYAVSIGARLADVLEHDRFAQLIDYNSVWLGRSEWKLLTPIDHPVDACRCVVTGTGLTHHRSMQARHQMHVANSPDHGTVTDSQRVYEWGVAGGRPSEGQIGVQPEWFYKGTGAILSAHRETLTVPAFAEDGGEEAEIAGIYIVGPSGAVHRIGFTTANEFSDHIMEEKNYAYLASSKLRQCAIGPELACGVAFDEIVGTSEILREGSILWAANLQSGDQSMVHSLGNLEHHHFKIPAHRRPGDVHVHFLGTSAFSFSHGVKLQAGDEMVIHFPVLGRPLVNSLLIETGSNALVCAQEL